MSLISEVFDKNIHSKYIKCKKIVKLWEHHFKEKYNRIPSKLDIKEADVEIKYAYKTYYLLKTEALEKSFNTLNFEIEEFCLPQSPTSADIINNFKTLDDTSPKEDAIKIDSLKKLPIICNNKSDEPLKVNKNPKKLEIWGSHLNKKPIEKLKHNFLKYETVALSQKHFTDQKKKRNPKKLFLNKNSQNKTLSNSQSSQQSDIRNSQESETSNNSQNYCSQPNNSSKNNSLSLNFELSDSQIEATENNLSSFQQNEEINLFYSQENLLSSNNEQEKLAKQFNIDNNLDLERELTQFDIPLTPEKEEFKTVDLQHQNEFTKVTQRPLDHDCLKNNADVEINDEDELIPSSDTEDDYLINCKKLKRCFSKNNLFNQNDFSKVTENKLELSPGNETKRIKINHIEKNQLKSVNLLKADSMKINRRTLNEQWLKNITEQNDKEINLNNLIDDSKSKHDLNNQITKATNENKSLINFEENEKIERLKAKIKDGTLNDNFVSINIKKKKFVRGKKSFSLSNYKKKKYYNLKKSNKKSTSINIDSYTCFTCNKKGHFSDKCPLACDEGLLPLDQDSNVQTKKQNKTQTKNSKIEKFDNNFDNFDKFKKIEPIYKLNDDNTLIETPLEIYTVLKQEFSHDNFRPGQEIAIMRILSGISTLLTLGTGSGKSLCYQLPAYMYAKYRSPCVALVISPLVSLMEDQTKFSKRTGCYHSGMSEKAKEKTLELVNEGQLDSLLISPEAVFSSLNYISKFLPPISFVCIDEVHCISQWSHNFRPSYLTLTKVLCNKLKVDVMLGLTATASLEVQKSITKHLKIDDKFEKSIGDLSLPNNLILSVSLEENKETALVNLINSEMFKEFNSIVVYCTRQEECNRIAQLLRSTFGYSADNVNIKKRKRVHWFAEAYHAGLSASKRTSLQKEFMSGNLRVIVATVAFGMGINKSDIRSVIHYDMPKNFESYVQEIGRAGRDGEFAFCHLFIDSKGQDRHELKRHIYTNNVDRYMIRKLLQKVFKRCGCPPDDCNKHEILFSIDETVKLLNISEEAICTLLCYLELKNDKFIDVLNPTYNHCKIISYQGVELLKTQAKFSVVLDHALKLQGDDITTNIIEFEISDLINSIKCDSDEIKSALKKLEWNFYDGSYKKTSLRVQFSDLSFHVRALGNLTDDQLDDALNYLYDSSVNKIKNSLCHLKMIHDTFLNINAKSILKFDDEDFYKNSDVIKKIIMDYFLNRNVRSDVPIEAIDKDKIVSSVRGLITSFKDTNFTARDIANVLYGISTPNYPAIIWARNKFWRSHLGDDFNSICQLASNELIKLKL